MPKKYGRKHKRRMSGGLFGFGEDSSSSSSSGTGSSSSGSGSMFGNLFGSSSSSSTTSGNKNQSMFGNLFGSDSGTTSTSQPTSYGTSGGKSRKRRRTMRGGYRDNISTTNLAANAAPFSGDTAKPHTWVGGRTRRRRRGTRRHRRH